MFICLLFIVTAQMWKFCLPDVRCSTALKHQAEQCASLEGSFTVRPVRVPRCIQAKTRASFT